MTKAFDCAMRLLVRREHGMRELINKLSGKGYDRADCEDAVSECQRLGYQSDERFAELFCSARIRQGYGPLRISQELQSKQIDRDLIDTVLGQQQGQWEARAFAAWQKKYKGTESPDYTERKKHQQFLMYRGFSADTIANMFAFVKTMTEVEFRG